MTVRPILKMGDPRLFQVAQPVGQFDRPELHALIADMFDTMQAANGAGLAAPQIGISLQIVIFGFKHNTRYPDAPEVPETVLLNPVLTPLSRAACRFPACAAACPATPACAIKASTSMGSLSIARSRASMHG